MIEHGQDHEPLYFIGWNTRFNSGKNFFIATEWTVHRSEVLAIVVRSTVTFYDLLQVIWLAKPIKSNPCSIGESRRYRGRYFLAGSQDSGSAISRE